MIFLRMLEGSFGASVILGPPLPMRIGLVALIVVSILEVVAILESIPPRGRTYMLQWLIQTKIIKKSNYLTGNPLPLWIMLLLILVFLI